MFFHFAPVQGHTDAPYRHFHSKFYGNDSCYYTPFIRLEKDGIRNRDLKDVVSPLNDEINLVPQIIFRDDNELNTLVSMMKEQGISRIDLNMGCPFPLQTGHGRGAATIANPDLAKAVVETVSNNPDVKFSVKMRLGMNSNDEWKTLIPHLNEIELEHITVHPRIARQQYGGDVDTDAFGKLLQESKNPVIYNGDILSPQDITRINDLFPQCEGVMIGRGLLGRPSLVSEFLAGKELSREERLEKMLKFHRALLDYYQSTLCGDAQIISKIKPFWEYAENEIGRKPWKAIKKANNIAKYHSAVASIEI